MDSGSLVLVLNGGAVGAFSQGKAKDIRFSGFGQKEVGCRRSIWEICCFVPGKRHMG